MKLSTDILTLLASLQLAIAIPSVASAQWYMNPQNRGIAAGGNGFTNGIVNGNAGLVPGAGVVPAAAALPGNGIVPGNPLVPGTGAIGTGTAATTGTDTTPAQTDAGDDGGGGAAYGSGYSFTSDPISAETSAEFNGMANLIRSEGSYNRQTSKALINYETARSMYIDNQEKLWGARRAIYRAKLAARAEDVEYAHATEARAEAFMAAHRPLPLAGRQLNASTGHIAWPDALLAPEFDQTRTALDSLFEARALSAGTPSQSVLMKQRVNDMKEILHEQVLKMPLENYSQARIFLDQLGVSFH